MKIVQRAALVWLLAVVAGLNTNVLTPYASATAAEVAAADNKTARAGDIDALYAFMKATHPDLFQHTKETDFASYIATFKRNAPSNSWSQYVMGVYRMMNMIGDGHAAIYPIPSAGPGFDARYPIITEAFADGLFVIRADSAYREIVGAKIVAVAGKPTAEIVRKVNDYWGRENNMWPLRWTPLFLRRPGYLHGTGIATGDIAGPVTFTFMMADGTKRDVPVTPVAVATDAERQKTDWINARDETKRAKPTPLHGTDMPFGFHYIKDRKAVYAVYRQADDTETETVAAFADRLFKFIGANAVDKLIIDVRENGGGNNYKNQSLLLSMIKERKLDRPGHLFILVGRRTFSAAQNFANQAERWTQSIFIGEPTGSSPNMFGDGRPFTLPATKIEVIIPSLRWQDSDPQDNRVWIMPDVIARETMADYLSGNDRALTAALDYQLPADFKEVSPFEHWQRPNQWIKIGDKYTPIKEIPFAW